MPEPHSGLVPEKFPLSPACQAVFNVYTLRMTELKNGPEWREAVRGIMTFKYLSDSEVDRLLEGGAVVQFDRNETIVREGDLDHHFFGILSGTVSVSVRETDGKDVFICALGAGEVFGEAGFFLKIHRTATVVAKDRAVAFRLNRSELAGFIKAFPSAGNKILLITIYGLLKKLRAANQELAYERKADLEQDDIDDLVGGILGEIAAESAV